MAVGLADFVLMLCPVNVNKTIAGIGIVPFQTIEDVVVLGVLAEDETVQVAAWREFPEPPPKLKWQALGTMNDLISSRFSLLRMGGER